MDGVQFVVDDKGNKKAVQLDLTLWGELWEDLYDSMIIRHRAGEPCIPLDEVVKELESQATSRA